MPCRKIGSLAILLLACLLFACAGPEEDARTLLNEALKLKAEGQLQEAIQKLKEVEERYPSTVAASEAIREHPLLERALERLQAERVELAVASLSSALDLFRFDVGRYPLEAEGPAALMERPAGVAGMEHWAGPYLRKLPNGVEQLTYMSNGECFMLYPPGAELPPIALSRFERADLVNGSRRLRAYVAMCRKDEEFPMLLRGRPLGDLDFSTEPKVGQVNEEFAKKYRVDLGDQLALPNHTLEVVGIVGDSYQCPTIYMPGQ